MKKFIIDYFNKFKNKTVKSKIWTISLLILYISILLVCIIPVECESTSPGFITKVGNVITLKTDEESNSRIYTCSVRVYTSVSCFQYAIAKLDKNTDIESYDHSEDDFTINEDYKMSVCAKNQSLQDAIITAYNYAKENNYDVDLKYEYSGVCVAAVPSNYYESGPESLQIGDVVTKVGDVVIDNMNTFRAEMENFLREYELDKNRNRTTTTNISIIRNNEEMVLTNCRLIVLANLGGYSIQAKEANIENVNEYLYYNYYKIDYSNSKPSININLGQSTGPSGGLMQTIYVYNTITNGSIAENKVLIGTGTISTDGSVGKIGGAKQKIVTANYYAPSFFFVPKENYEEVIEQYNKIKSQNIDFDHIISVTTFEDVLNVLKEGE